MRAPHHLFEKPGRTTIAGAPEGLDAWLLADLAARAAGGVLHIARDDARMAMMADSVRFFAPGLDLVLLPAWDCLPYDRVSPNPEISARRMAALSRLARANGPRLVITTVNAALQRVPHIDTVKAASFQAEAGSRIDEAELSGYLAQNGYSRTGTVMEPGEYAVRGGLIDIFPPGSDEPIRLDLFGDTLESLRRFDALSQRTTAPESRLDLVPVSEVLLDEAAINRFRARYRELFGAAGNSDPLYEAISAGRKHMGMEHWLPLFHDSLQTLPDYLPDAVITLDHLAEEARDARLAAIDDYYQTRHSVMEAGAGDDASVYKPVPSEQLYLNDRDWDALLTERPVAAFSPFDAPDEDKNAWRAGGRQGRDFAIERNQPDGNVYDALAAHIRTLQQSGKRPVLASYSAGARERLSGVVHDHGVTNLADVDHFADIERLPDRTVGLAVLGLEQGFETADIAVISEQDVLGDRLVRPRKKQRRAENFIAEASQLGPGDLVVHVDHGIGRYEGLETIDVAGAAHDCLLVIYADGDKLYLPVENIEMLSRYGSDTGEVQLDRLGGTAWQHRKARLKQRLKDMADQLIKIAAGRELKDAPPLTPQDGVYDEFCARFPYQETDDQARAIGEVLGDLGSGRPMDRLVCGDVGFGKTEVALRSAFVAVMSGRQVAVVVPTTLLCRQHYKTFVERFAGLPVRIGQLSRMVPAADQRDTKDGIADGGVDIVVGTHALLGKSIKFRDLGLLIVDEEQHFGVRHKERLKQLRNDVHVLTLTATPIPRTLQLAMAGIRELSLIASPPVDRLAVRTFVLPTDPVVVREALLREHYRGGQSFYVCPRISDLVEIEEFLKEHVPEVKFTTAHGRMAPTDLERVMNAFYDRSVDVLICTNIIESGLDIPTANTMIVHRSDMFGLAQLYQLRGRIGRSKIRAYAYLTLPPRKKLTVSAERRLRAMQAMDSLGAGFSLASHDLDIRGAGNLLGEEQSGHIKEVGAELYQHLLEEAVAMARGGDTEVGDEAWSPQISIGTAVLIPEEYVADLGVRLELYRRIARLEDKTEIESFAAEMIDRFGPLPEEVENLLEVVAIKRLCRDANVEKLEAGPRGATLTFRGNRFDNPAGLVEFISVQVGTAKLRPDHTLVYLRQWEEPGDRLKGVHHLISNLAKMAKVAA